MEAHFSEDDESAECTEDLGKQRVHLMQRFLSTQIALDTRDVEYTESTKIAEYVDDANSVEIKMFRGYRV